MDTDITAFVICGTPIAAADVAKHIVGKDLASINRTLERIGAIILVHNKRSAPAYVLGDRKGFTVFGPGGLPFLQEIALKVDTAKSQVVCREALERLGMERTSPTARWMAGVMVGS